MKAKILLSLFVLFLFVGNSIAAEVPEFVRTKNWKIEKVSTGSLLVSMTAVFYNPNKAKAKLNDINLEVILGETKAGNVIQTGGKVKIKKNSAFEIPLEIEIAPETSAWGYLSGFFSAVTLQDITVEIKGYIKVKVLGIPLRIKVDEIETVNAKDIF
ncbi:MAG: hypothetical protein ACPG4Z_00795 [Chitinophagales bacterium]